MIITVTFSIQCRYCGQKMFTENGDIAIERQERQFIVRDDWAGACKCGGLNSHRSTKS